MKRLYMIAGVTMMLSGWCAAQTNPPSGTPLRCTMNCLDVGTIRAIPAVADPALDQGRHRLFVLTDVGGDNDDTQSLVRLLLYANEIDLEGLVATTSTFMMDRTNPATIEKVVDAYGEVRANLVKHDAHYPAAEQLQSLIRSGVPVYGMGGVGTGKDSGGSAMLVAALKARDPRPLWVSIWGGANTLAQALWTIRTTETRASTKGLVAKLRVYAIGDQDDSGAWLRKEFPDLFWITPLGFNTGIASRDAGSKPEMISAAWLAKNIQQGHGPMGEVYPDTAYAMEGDTPAFPSLIPNGLNNPSHPDYGGWGGRFALYTPAMAQPLPPSPNMHSQNLVAPTVETRPLWTAASDTYRGAMTWTFPPIAASPGDAAPASNAGVTVWRWREDFQNDFAARMEWTRKPYSEANHPPVAVLAGNTPPEFSVHGGEEFHLNASPSYDPDHDSISYFWFDYVEAGDLGAPVSVAPFSRALADLPVTAPRVTEPKTIHFIVRVTDKGTPALSRYRRVVVHVLP